VRVLQVNKFGVAISGAETYFLELSRRLAGRGNEVATMCMRPDDARALALPCYEVPYLDFHAANSLRDRVRAAHMVWSGPEASRVFQRALDEVRPHVVHFHNIAHQLSHEIVRIAQRSGVPSVMTCHDYKLVCPAYTAVRNGEECFDCSKDSVHGCLQHRCLHDSLAWSGLATLDAWHLRRDARFLPQVLICPSRFMADRLRESWIGRTASRVEVVPNPVDPVDIPPRADADGGLYVGRLSREKGLDTAIEASARSGVRRSWRFEIWQAGSTHLSHSPGLSRARRLPGFGRTRASS
jgi:glycosyltransferase involved in cell wall biosynthesis